MTWLMKSVKLMIMSNPKNPFKFSQLLADLEIMLSREYGNDYLSDFVGKIGEAYNAQDPYEHYFDIMHHAEEMEVQLIDIEEISTN